MMTVIITPQNREIEVREGFTLALPKFLWQVMEARAEVLHGGNLQASMAELILEELTGWFIRASRKAVAAPAPSLN